MTVSLIEKEIKRFLASPTPEVLCIRGKWGVGKTFGWNACLRNAKNQQAGIALGSYAYVSLFGLISLAQLKFAIFENSLATKDIGTEPSVETFKSNTIGVAKRLGRKGLSLLDKLPPTKDYATAVQSLSFLSVRNTIVCFDDLERKGDTLSMKDVLGLASQLKEQKQCKVVLILNEDALIDGNKRDFDLYSEKVIDVSVAFAPSSQDCVRIGIIESSPANELLKRAIVALQISNIRVIKKIERLVLRVVPLLEKFDAKVLHQAVQSLTVLGWSAYVPDSCVPSIEYLRNKRGKHLFGLTNVKNQTDDEKRWGTILDAFGFGTMDEFDLVLLQGIQRGFFDDEAVINLAENLDKRAKSEQLEGSFHAAWRLYHDSFDNNERDIVAKLWSSFQNGVKVISPANLNATIKLLKDLGYQKEAEESLNYYMNNRDEKRDFFDLSRSPFGDEVTEPEVRAAFSAKHQSFQDNRSPVDILENIAKDGGWSHDDAMLLSKLSADDFYDMFKGHKNKDVSRIVLATLQFETVNDAKPEVKAISAKSRDALVRIGRESQLNRRRVEKKYRVEVPE